MSSTINEIRVAPSYLSDRDAAIYVNLPRPYLALALPWEQVPELITKLRRAYNEHQHDLEQTAIPSIPLF